MKRGTPQHPKTLELASELDVPRYVAVGLLEELWHWTAAYARRGDIGRFTDGAIARGIGWDGDASRLIAALRKCRWLDDHADHRLVVHDWHDHADDGVNMAIARAGERFATDNSIPKMSRMAQAERAKALSRYAEVEGESPLTSSSPPAITKPEAGHTHAVDNTREQEAHGVATEGTQGEHCLSLSLGQSPVVDDAAGAPSARRKPVKAEHGQSQHAEFIQGFMDLWRRCFREEYHFQNAKDGVGAKTVLKACRNDVTKALRFAAQFMQSQDRLDVSAGHTIAMFGSRINAYLSGGASRQQIGATPSSRAPSSVPRQIVLTHAE